VQIQTPDRPGVMQRLLRALTAQINRAAMADAGDLRWLEAAAGGPSTADAAGERDVDVLYALTPVVDGQALSGRLLVRLPEHRGGNEHWAEVDWQEIERAVARTVTEGASEEGGRLTDAERTTRKSDDTVVRLDLVRHALPDTV